LVSFVRFSYTIGSLKEVMLVTLADVIRVYFGIVMAYHNTTLCEVHEL
jgi:hypothetical protein